MADITRHLDSLLSTLADTIEVKAVKIIDAEKLVAWGKLRRAVTTKYYADKAQIDVFVNDKVAPYALYVHEGREPGKMPPVSILEEWARKKRLLSNSIHNGKNSLYSAKLAKTKLSVRINPSAKLNANQQQLQANYHSLAWAIASKIKKHGIKPRRFLLQAILESLKELKSS